MDRDRRRSSLFPYSWLAGDTGDDSRLGRMVAAVIEIIAIVVLLKAMTPL